jgi:hypothetical protein
MNIYILEFEISQRLGIYHTYIHTCISYIYTYMYIIYDIIYVRQGRQSLSEGAVDHINRD